MIKGKRLHDMMCSTSESYLALYVNKSVGDRLKQEIRKPRKIEFSKGAPKVIGDMIHQHLIKKGFI